MKCSEKFSLRRIQNELYKQIGTRLSNQESQFVESHFLTSYSHTEQPTSILKHSTWKTIVTQIVVVQWINTLLNK